jgi:hypothetical protein
MHQRGSTQQTVLSGDAVLTGDLLPDLSLKLRDVFA